MQMVWSGLVCLCFNGSVSEKRREREREGQVLGIEKQGKARAGNRGREDAVFGEEGGSVGLLSGGGLALLFLS